MCIGVLDFLWQAWKFIEPGLYRQEKRFVRFLVPGSALLTITGIAFLYFVMLPLMLQVLISFGIPGPENAFGIPDPETRIEATAADGATVLPVLTDPPTDPAPGQAWVDPVTRSLMVVVPTTADGTSYELLSTPLGREGTISQEFRLGEYIGFVLTLAIAITIAFQMPLVIVLMGWIGIARRSFLTRNRRYALLICAVLGAILTPADIVSMVLLFVPLYLLYEFGILLLAVAPAEKVASGTLIPGLGGDGSRTSKDDGETDQDSHREQIDSISESDETNSPVDEEDDPPSSDDDSTPGAS